MTYSMTWEKRGVCISYSEVADFAEFMGAVLTIHKSPHYQSLKYVIHDMSAVKDLDFAQVDMTQIVAHELGARYSNPNIKACVVTASPEMGIMVKAFSVQTKLDVGLFNSQDEARAWCV